jgi:hypothetical protein
MAVEARIGVLEKEMSEMKGVMKRLIDAFDDLNKQVGKKHEEPAAEESSGGSISSESRLAGKKVKLPVFEGEVLVAWITRAEIYFDVQNTVDDMKVKLARLSMEGAAIHWFNSLMETEDQLIWENHKKSLIACYGGRRLENSFEELSTLRQTGSVEEFPEAFELLSSQVGHLPEEQYLGYFMSGLKPIIRRRVRTLNPQSRMQMMRIAKDVEEELHEENDEGNRALAKKNWGRTDSYGPGSRYRSGLSLTQKDTPRSANSGWINPARKTEPSGSNSNSNLSLNSTGRKTDGDHRSSATERWRGI